jgi:hypothetical protein
VEDVQSLICARLEDLSIQKIASTLRSGSRGLKVNIMVWCGDPQSRRLKVVSFGTATAIIVGFICISAGKDSLQ